MQRILVEEFALFAPLELVVNVAIFLLCHVSQSQTIINNYNKRW
jgi:hypothetical protein